MLAAVASCSLVLTSCGGGSDPVPGEQAAEVSVSTGSQQVWCAGDGPAVVLVNGIGHDATSAQWVEVERALTASARVCRYDRPGTGGSDAPRISGRGADELDAELDAVVDHAAGGGRVVLVAHSFGGYLARTYADRHPDRVDGLVFVDALDPSVGVLRGTGASSREEVAMADERPDLGDIERAAQSVTTLADSPHLVVLVRGEDAGEPRMAGQQQLAALSGRSRTVVVPDAGHQIPSEAPEAVAAAVEDVLRLAG